MSIGSAKGMLARLKKLERSKVAGDELREWVESTFRAAIADGRICPVDGDVVLHCLLVWISDGTARGYAGEGVLR
ncbi:hypothetical protein L541_3198 [Bordetella hinzii CA90 BAL1384]|uniref:hypothetical protein n=1 Tax=Bordetella hinzii TaxID=103855 RepID=UPI00045A4EBD|nr:hypothetical protein [Bordetella hinzii]KCB32491.1 hypothetical protein L541_3198 [Bordetella hinzii CA90 BAL1384]